MLETAFGHACRPSVGLRSAAGSARHPLPILSVDVEDAAPLAFFFEKFQSKPNEKDRVLPPLCSCILEEDG